MAEDKEDLSVVGNTSMINTQCLLGNIDECLDNLQPKNQENSSHPSSSLSSAQQDQLLADNVSVESNSKSDTVDTTNCVETVNDNIRSDKSEMQDHIQIILSAHKFSTENSNISTQETPSKLSSYEQISSQNATYSSFVSNSGKIISKKSEHSSQSLELFTPESQDQNIVEERETGTDISGDRVIIGSKRRRSSESHSEEYCKKSKISEDNESLNEESKNNSSEVSQILAESVEAEAFENNSFEIGYNFDKEPGQITGAWEEFSGKENNFVKGCKWSPDGSCLLTNSNDNTLRLFNTPPEVYGGSMQNVPEMKSVLKMKVGETIYDYCWYPLMNSSDPDSCCLISTSRCMPIHMWDAFSGELLCSYRSYDQADELVAAHSVAFNNDGSKIYCGFNKTVRVFDVSRPGRQFESRKTFVKSVGQPGIISCIKFSPVDNSLYAAGSYSRSIALYYEPEGELAWSFTGHQGGVTHIVWSPDGTKLYSGARKDNEIICWDLRNPSKILFSVDRKVETNQRIYFDLDSTGRYLVSGNHDGTVSIWDVLELQDSRPKPILTHKAHNDTVNGVSLNPYFPVIATSSGQRHFPMLGDSDDSDNDDLSQTTDSIDNSVGLWWFGS